MQSINKCIISSASGEIQLPGLLDSVLCSNSITIKTRLRILKAYIWSVLLYGCESWTIFQKMEKRINSAEAWFMRCMLGIICSDRISNEDVWKRSGCSKGQLMKIIVKRQMTSKGHVYQHRNIKHLVLTGSIPGLKSLGRSRRTLMDNLATCSRLDKIELFWVMDNCSHWRVVVVDAVNRQGC